MRCSTNGRSGGKHFGLGKERARQEGWKRSVIGCGTRRGRRQAWREIACDEELSGPLPSPWPCSCTFMIRWFRQHHWLSKVPPFLSDGAGAVAIMICRFIARKFLREGQAAPGHMLGNSVPSLESLTTSGDRGRTPRAPASSRVAEALSLAPYVARTSSSGSVYINE